MSLWICVTTAILVGFGRNVHGTRVNIHRLDGRESSVIVGGCVDEGNENIFRDDHSIDLATKMDENECNLFVKLSSPLLIHRVSMLPASSESIDMDGILSGRLSTDSLMPFPFISTPDDRETKIIFPDSCNTEYLFIQVDLSCHAPQSMLDGMKGIFAPAEEEKEDGGQSETNGIQSDDQTKKADDVEGEEDDDDMQLIGGESEFQQRPGGIVQAGPVRNGRGTGELIKNLMNKRSLKLTMIGGIFALIGVCIYHALGFFLPALDGKDILSLTLEDGLKAPLLDKSQPKRGLWRGLHGLGSHEGLPLLSGGNVTPIRPPSWLGSFAANRGTNKCLDIIDEEESQERVPKDSSRDNQPYLVLP